MLVDGRGGGMITDSRCEVLRAGRATSSAGTEADRCLRSLAIRRACSSSAEGSLAAKLSTVAVGLGLGESDEDVDCWRSVSIGGLETPLRLSEA